MWFGIRSKSMGGNKEKILLRIRDITIVAHKHYYNTQTPKAPKSSL